MMGFYTASLQKMTCFIKYTIFKSFFMYKKTFLDYILGILRPRNGRVRVLEMCAMPKFTKKKVKNIFFLKKENHAKAQYYLFS